MILALALALAQAQSKPIVLMAVGDIMLDRYVGRAIDMYGTGYPLDKVRATLNTANVLFANLECPITNQPKELRKRFVFQVPPARLSALEVGRPWMLSLANNHSLDCGRAGLQDTISFLESKHMTPIGAGDSPWGAKVVTTPSFRIVFLGYSDFPEKATGTVPGVTYYDEKRLVQAIQDFRGYKNFFVVVGVHWGVEGDGQPSERQRHEAKVMADAGADLILGSHPHVLQPVEWIKRPNGHKTCVVYSMGDFVFDTIKPNEQRSAIFKFTITKEGIQGLQQISVRIRNVRPELVDSIMSTSK